MPESREVVLGRIRVSLADRANHNGNAAAEYSAIAREYIRAGRLDAEARLGLFLERLRDYETQVVKTRADLLPQAISMVLRQHEQNKVIAADGLAREILPVDFQFLPEREADLQDLNDCDGILTTCTVAIAFTGTIVLTHGPGEGARRLSLLPDRHLCVVRADQVVETVSEAMDSLAPFAAHPLTFISGPSATADIEMTRIRGVHGPRFLDVLLVH